jgi:hypothetical protein
MNAWEAIQESVEKICEDYRLANADGKINLKEASGLVMSALGEFVQLTQQIGAIPGEEKKAAAMTAVEFFIDHVITPLNIPYAPDAIVDPIIKGTLMDIADELLEVAVRWFKRTEWPQEHLSLVPQD